MKKLLALLIGLVLALSAVCASAEGLPMLTQLHQTVYAKGVNLTPESYPQVFLSPYSTSRFLEYHSYPVSPTLYTIFSAPEGSLAVKFETEFATFYNGEQNVAYSYQQMDSYSLEVFLAYAKREDWIIADGSEGYAAYVDHSENSRDARAFGLIPTREHGRTAYLRITTAIYDLPERTDECAMERAVPVILNEIERVRSTMQIVEADFWSRNAFKGVVYHSVDLDMDAVFNFPAVTAVSPEGTVEVAYPYVYQSEASEIGLMTNFSFGSLEVSLKLGTYAYPFSMQKDDPASVTTVTASDGNEYVIYAANTSDGGIYSIYAARHLYDKAGSDKTQNLYIEFYFRLENLGWADIDDFVTTTLDSWVTNMAFDTDYTLFGSYISSAELPPRAHGSGRLHRARPGGTRSG